MENTKWLLIEPPAPIDYEAVTGWLRQTVWAADQTTQELMSAVTHGVAVAAIDRNGGRTLGFGRVVTDFHTFAYLTDVIVAEDARRLGIARAISKALLDHPKLANVRHWSLIYSGNATRALYTSLGFEASSHQAHWFEHFRVSNS